MHLEILGKKLALKFKETVWLRHIYEEQGVVTCSNKFVNKLSLETCETLGDAINICFINLLLSSHSRLCVVSDIVLNYTFEGLRVCLVQHSLCVKAELLSLMHNCAKTEQHFPSCSRCDFRLKRGGVVLYQCLCFDIITWPLWQQIWSAAKHLKSISQDSAQLANSFKYRPDTLALLEGQPYICWSTCTHTHTESHIMTLFLSWLLTFPIQWGSLLIALPEGHLLSLSSHSPIKIWSCQVSVLTQLLLVCTSQFFTRQWNRFGRKEERLHCPVTVCHDTVK